MTSDQEIGRRVKATRGARSQTSLAVSMAMLGGWTTWKQQTVGRIEAGAQSLRLAEAVTLCDILGCTLEDLVSD